MRKVHFFSGLCISVFVGVHLFNHFMSIFGPEVHIETMQKLRSVYRNLLVESVLLLAVLLQIVSGLNLFFKQNRKELQFFRKLHIWSGLYLAIFLLIHVGAVLGGRYILKLDTNFYFGVAGLNTFPFLLFFIPYYSLAILSFFAHIAAIHFQKMKKKIFGLNNLQQARMILAIGILLTTVLLFGLTNGFSGHKIPKEFNILIGG